MNTRAEKLANKAARRDRWFIEANTSERIAKILEVGLHRTRRVSMTDPITNKKIDYREYIIPSLSA